jgi:hypothetical protein
LWGKGRETVKKVFKILARARILVLSFLLIGMTFWVVRVPEASAASQVDINNRIEKGLAYLNSIQASDGSWGSSYAPVACTAMAVLAFENAPNSHYGWNLTDPYHATVQKGLDYLFAQAHVQVLTNKTVGNPPQSVSPDTNGNGNGIDFYTYNQGDPHYTDETYQTPMVLMAIVASQNETQIATTGPANVTGRSYYDIAVDIVDWIAWAQSEAGTGRGGWRYTANFTALGPLTADNSVSQWPVLGLMAAQLWGINASAWVKSELNYWITTDQDSDLTKNNITNSNYGSFGYTAADTFNGVVLETATGILELTYIGAPSNNASIIAAEGYINKMWNYYDGKWNVNLGSLYDMYAVMKAMRETTPTPTQFVANYNGTPGVEWYNGTGEYADALLANQNQTDGSWLNWKNWAEDVDPSLSTAWGVLILEYVPVKVNWQLTVKVVDASNDAPIASAAVDVEGQGSYSGTTNSNGQVVFPAVLAGPNSINASKPGYNSASVIVSLTNDTETTIRLTPSTSQLVLPNAQFWILAIILGLGVILGMGVAIFLIAGADRIRRKRKKK